MIDRVLFGWYTQQKNGLDAPIWEARFIARGLNPKEDHAPIYVDRVPRNGKNADKTITIFPELRQTFRNMLASRGRGCLVVPNFGHFAYEAVWKSVWAAAEEYGAVVLDCDADKVVEDYETGLKLLQSYRGRTNAEKRKRARMRTGRKKLGTGPTKKQPAIEMFGNPDVTLKEIGDFLGCGPLTVRRRMREWTGVYEKADAVLLAADGRWPPKRKNLSE